ncbi:hypothetical protein C0995_013694 [Termitomyces sp. Mi166|nr:hypothetical protein C0995_013694 [Termitomyces sp. Mi166\
MGQVIRAQRHLHTIFKVQTHHNKAPAKLCNLDFAESNSYVWGIMKEIIHNSSCKKATLSVGNVLPVSQCPQSTIIGNVEEKTHIHLPSGAKKTIYGGAHVTIGIVAGGGRIDKPLLKADHAYYKFKAKRYNWPHTHGVAMNPVDHPHDGGNHQHIGKASTIACSAVPGQKVSLIAACRTGLLRGTIKVKEV